MVSSPQLDLDRLACHPRKKKIAMAGCPPPSQPLKKKLRAQLPSAAPMLAHTCQPLWAAVYTYGRLVIQIHMFPATSCYISFPVPTSPYIYILCRSLFNPQVESPVVFVDVARLCREWNRQYCVFWDEGVVNLSRTPQMLSISGFPAWKNNEQEENKIVPGLLLPKDWAKKRFSAAKVFFL